MGDVSVDVFTIPMVEFDCLGGFKRSSFKMGLETPRAATTKLLFSKALIFALKFNRFSQENYNFLAAMIYGGERYLFYGWSSPIFVPNTQYDIMTEFLRHLGTSHNNAWKMCVYTLEVSRPGNHIHNSFFVCATKLATRYSF